MPRTIPTPTQPLLCNRLNFLGNSLYGLGEMGVAGSGAEAGT